MIGMKQFKDKEFDLAIVDPPYFSGPEKRKFYGNEVSPIKVKRRDYPIDEIWDVPDETYFKELIRVSKHQIIWGCNYYNYDFGPGRIIWDKVNGESSFSCAEIAYCSLHDSVRMFRFMWNGMMQGKSISEGHIMQGNKKLNEKRIHQTQKPVELYRWLMSTYAKKGFKLLSTHVGSGSDRIAADDLGFDFVGFEISKVHHENQEKRYQEHISQQKLNF